MTRRFTLLAWTAAAATYLLIVLGAVVRITGSGMGCGDHWPLCNGRLFPPLDDLGTLIEWSHRLVAAIVSALIAGLALYAWWLRRVSVGTGASAVGRGPYAALGLLVVQVLLGAVTVKLELPPWTTILHLGTAMLVLAALLVPARTSSGDPPGPGSPGWRPGSALILPLAFVTVLFGALTANLGAAAGCSGFPLCSGQFVPTVGGLAWIHWTHRLLAYALAGTALWWVWKAPGRPSWAVSGLVLLQVGLGAATVLLGLPAGLQAAHLAVGTAVWGAVVLAR